MLGFIHIPKTGGTYITGRQYKNLAGGKPRRVSAGKVITGITDLRHVVIVTGHKKKFFHGHATKKTGDVSKYTLVTNVRNPFSWLVSYGSSTGDWSELRSGESHPDRKIANESFKEFVQKILSRTKKWPGKGFLFQQMSSPRRV